MAKNRSGLGRGLGALLGDEPAAPEQEAVKPSTPEPTSEPAKSATPQTEPESAPKEPANPVEVKKEAPTTVPAAHKSEPSPAPKRPQQREAPKKAATRIDPAKVAPAKAEESAPAKRSSNISEELRKQTGDVKPYIEEDDHVVIKGVVERQKNEIDINMIRPNPDQPRTRFDKEELEELSESIKNNGLLQPILVRKVNTMYQIIAGERRWQACKLVGLKTVPVNIMKADDDKVIELAMIENIQRSDLNPIEEAYGYRRLMERKGLTQSQLAQAVSKGRSTIANSLRLLELPEDAQQLLFEGKITSGHARAILSVPTPKGRQTLTEKMLAGDMSVREAESLARLLSGRKSETTTARPPIPQEYRTVAKNLSKALGTNVRVKSSKGKNKIEIEFKDEDQLQSLFERILDEE